MKRLVLILIALFSLVACGDSGPTAGVVIAHEYDDPDDWYQPGHTIGGGQTCTGGYNGQPRICTQNAPIHIPGVWHHDPERFLLVLEDAEGKRGSVSVGRQTWDAVKDGQHYDHKTGQVTSR